MTFDLDLGLMVTQNVAQYPLHHVTFAATKFEVAKANSLGGDIITRNRMHIRTHTQTGGWYEINIPFFHKNDNKRKFR